MKRLIVILFLIPSLAFATYTEFYCQSGGSNLNACSSTNNTATYTSIHGNWVSATGVFTPTDSTTPASTVSVGMWASVYIDGATVGVYIGRISAVGAGTNGAITANTTGIGVKPADQTGTATIKVEGACQGPNAASGYPLTLATWGLNKDSTSHKARLNLKNDQTYTLTASFAMPASGAGSVIQGYTSSTNDGGRATFDGTTNTGTIFTTAGTINHTFTDLIFKTSITTGTTDLVTPVVGNTTFIRCVFTGSRNNGLLLAASTVVIECEAYDNNKANTASKAGFNSGAASVILINCISHDNTGSNSAGFFFNANQAYLFNCIADTNGGNGISFTANDASGQNVVQNCDFYNNTSDGINIASTTGSTFLIENCNFIKNGSVGIDNLSVVNSGFAYNNGYGAGTQANGGGADQLNNIVASGAVTYASNVTPWVDGPNGNFTINLAAALMAGRGAFTTTASSYGPTVGYPSIGAAQGPTPTPTPTATATATFTPTPVPTCTATATATATATPTATATNTPTPTATATSTPTPTPPIETSDAHQG